MSIMWIVRIIYIGVFFSSIVGILTALGYFLLAGWALILAIIEDVKTTHRNWVRNGRNPWKW